ncbi:DDE-1 domain-containing protein, partial [Pyrenophora tritici-repentis]
SVTVVETIAADGSVLVPFIILKGKVHLLKWYTNTKLPDDYMVAISDTAYNNDELSLEWIRHFDACVWPWDPERVLYKLARPQRVSTPEMSYLFQASETPTPTTPRSFVAYARKTQELREYTEYMLSNRAARLARASVILGLNYHLATHELAKNTAAARKRAQRQDNSRLMIQKGGVVTARGAREAVSQKAKIAEQKAVRKA